MILVVIESDASERVVEALRAALGLGLRGERVRVVLCERAERLVYFGVDPLVSRAVATLVEVGQEVRCGPEECLGDWLHEARAVEVWR